MSMIDLYDGETRTAYWWKQITTNSILTPVFLFFLCNFLPLYLGYIFKLLKINNTKFAEIIMGLLSSIGLFIYDPEHYGVNLIIFLVLLCAVFFALSLLKPNLAFSFYYWNPTLFVIIWFIGSPVIILYKISRGWKIMVASGSELFMVFFGIPVLIWFFIVPLKTWIIYKRFRIVAQDEGKLRI